MDNIFDTRDMFLCFHSDWRLLVSFLKIQFICSLMSAVTQQCVCVLCCNTAICLQAFQESICHCLQTYCLNYSTALLYLESLKAREDFGSYVKVQEGAHRGQPHCMCESECWRGRGVPWQQGRQRDAEYEREDTHSKHTPQTANNQFRVTKALPERNVSVCPFCNLLCHPASVQKNPASNGHKLRMVESWINVNQRHWFL